MSAPELTAHRLGPAAAVPVGAVKGDRYPEPLMRALGH